MSLYQKYRPQKFSDLIGQDSIKKTLINALKLNRIGHAYLFVGPRGTGKTTTARLLAKTINCIKRKKGEVEPCNNCKNCKEITNGHSLDVIEIDAASNRGIDDVRELRDKIRYAPNDSKFKIFIIDEVHMLTKESFNALLKTLEEPPKHAIFIMATTEPEKVLDTILSRVQEFDFKRATIVDIKQDLERIIKSEKMKIEPEALSLICQSADGSFRDAVTILDQVGSSGESNIKLETVEQIMGIVADKTVGEFIKSIVDNEPNKALQIINKIYSDGYNLAEFNNRIIEYLRNAMLMVNKLDLTSTISEKELPKVKAISELGIAKIFLLLNRFLEVAKEMKTTKIAQLPLELAVYDLCETNEQIYNITKEQFNKNTSESNDKKSIVNENPISTENKKSIGNIQTKWLGVIQEIEKNNHSLALLLKDSKLIDSKDNKILLSMKFKFYAERIKDGRNYAILTETIEKIFEQKLGIECVVDEQQNNNSTKEQVNKEANKQDDKSEDNNLMNDIKDVFDL